MRLIDADALLKDIRDHSQSYFADDFAKEWVDRQPTVHPEQPKIGEWVEDVAYYDEDGCPCIITRCNQCGEPNPVSNFCPICGAKMEV